MRFISLIAISILVVIVTVRMAEMLSTPDDGILISEFSFQQAGATKNAPLSRGTYETKDWNGGRLELTAMVPDAVEPIEYDVSILVANAHRIVDLSYCVDPGPTRANDDDPSVFKRYEPVYFPLPKGICAGKPFTLGVESTLNKPELGPVYFGTRDAVRDAFRWRQFFGVHVIMASAAIAVLAALIAMISLPLAQNRALYLSFIGLMSAWGFKNLLFVGPFYDLGQVSFVTWHQVTLFLVLSMLGILINEWTQQRRALRWALAVVAGLSVLTGMIQSVNLFPGLTAVIFLTVPGLGSLIIAIAVIQLAKYAQQRAEVSGLAIVLLLICAWVGLVDLLAFYSETLSRILAGPAGVTLPFIPLATCLAAYAMLILVSQRNQTIRQQIAQQNNHLQDRLAEKEAEMQKVYIAREEQQRETTALRERQRIMEDVHDGFGGRLLSLLLQAETGDLNGDDLKNGLRSSLQDLRLIVDSMDTADSELALALGALRGRIETDLRNAGIDLSWSMDLDDPDLRLGSRETLSIFRMVQEAVTNAIYHSQATHLTIAIKRRHGGKLLIEIEDNGTGFVQQARPGRGLKNIVSRARDLGGEADISGEGGCRILLRLPCAPLAQDKAKATV